MAPAAARASLVPAHSHWDVRNADHELQFCYTVTGSTPGAPTTIAFVPLRERDARNFMQLGITRTGFELKRRVGGSFITVPPLFATPQAHGAIGQEIMFDYVEQGSDFYIYGLDETLTRGPLLYHWRDGTYPVGQNISYYTESGWAGVWDFVIGHPLDNVGMPHQVHHLAQDARNHPGATGAVTFDDGTPASGGVQQITNRDTPRSQFGLASGNDYRYDVTVAGPGAGYIDFRDPGDSSDEVFFEHGWYRLTVPAAGSASIQQFSGAGKLVATHTAGAGGDGTYTLEMHGHAFTLSKDGAPVLAFTDTGPTSGLRVRVVPSTQTWDFTGTVLSVGGAPSLTSPGSQVPTLVSARVPKSPAGRQLRWLLGASARPPLSKVELRAHFSKRFLSSPGQSPAEINSTLRTVADASGLRLVRLTLVQPNALVARVKGRDAQALLITVVTDRKGRIDFGVIRRDAPMPERTLPAPTGRAAVGRDVVQIVDRARHGRRLLLTRWYPAASGARRRPRARYTSPLRTALGIPSARVHARSQARARRGHLPVVLFSPGAGTPRDIYQSLAEDLASHGYLVLAVDHTGETPVQFPDGHVAGGSVPAKHPIAAESAIRLADMRLILRRLNTMAAGPQGDRRRVAVVGHSLGGSTAAAVLRAEPTIRAGVDMDGSIFGPASQLGVARPFMVMAGGEGLDRSIRDLLEHSRGPRVALRIAGFAHFSLSDLPVTAPASIGAPRQPSIRDIALQRAYVRAFLGRYVLGHRSSLLKGPSRHWPQVSFAYRRRCCR